MSAHDARRQLSEISVRKRERCEDMLPVLLLAVVVVWEGQGASVLEFACVRQGRQSVIFAL